MKIRITALLAICLLVVNVNAGEPRDIYDEYWAFELQNNPFLATTSGDYRFNDRAPDVSAPAQRKRLQALEAIASRLDDTGDSLNADILAFILRHELALGAFAPWRIPFLSDAGFHMDVGYVVSSTRFESSEDYSDYLARLAALPGYLEQNRVNMQLGIETGFTQPREIMENILPSFDAQVTVSAEDHPLYAPFRDMPGQAGSLTIFSKADYEANNRDLEKSSLEPFLGTGAYVLASAGLLDGYACSAHWECLTALRSKLGS